MMSNLIEWVLGIHDEKITSSENDFLIEPTEILE